MRPYIRETRLVGNKQLRDQITFSDETKIRIYDDRLRPGIRLRGTFDKWSQKMEFPTDTDLTVRLPLWSPSAVKQWRAFEALTVLPDDTSIDWKVSDGTNDFWWQEYPDDLLVLAHLNDLTGQTFDLDYFRDGSAPSIVLNGSPSIVAPGVSGFGAGAALLDFDEGIQYNGTQLQAFVSTGCVRLRVKPGYSGAPTDYQRFFLSVNTAMLFYNAVLINHEPSGALSFQIRNATGGVILTDNSYSWNPTAGTWYEIELNFDVTPGTGFGATLRVGGTLVASAAGTGTRNTLTNQYSFGEQSPGSEVQNCVIDEWQVYNIVQHTADYTPETNELSPSWAIAGAGDWNTEAEISDNLPTFPVTERKIQLIARLTTTDIHVTPILVGYRFLINALYDPWEDLLRTIIRSLKARLSYVKDHPGAVVADTSTVNIQTDSAFIPEEKNLNVTDIDAVYNHDTDPGHDTDILDSFNSSTGEVTLTGAVTSGTTLWLRLVVVPDIKANFTSMDWTEVGKVPAVVIDTMEADSGQTRNSAELIDKGQGKAYRMKDSILIRELSVGGVLLTGKTRDQMRLQSALWGGIWNAPLLTSVALDVPYTFRLLSPLRFNPRANLSELRQTSFEASIKNVHLWLSDLEELPIVSTFNYSLTRQGIDRPVAEKIQPLSAGAVPGLVPGEPHEEP